MARYHFEVMDEGCFIRDDEGLEFADLETMQEQAMRAVGTMVGEKTTFPVEPWVMTIRDAQGETIVTLTFAAS